MGGQESHHRRRHTDRKNSMKAIDDIYAMFKQSNEVVLLNLKQSNPDLTKPRIQNIEDVVDQLVQPFKSMPKYHWSQQIYSKFKKHFTNNFEMLWVASREQFYELLLSNCKINYHQLIDKRISGWNFQNAFYAIATEHIEQKMAETFVGDIGEEELKNNLMNLSVLGEENTIKIEGKGNGDNIPSSLQEQMLSKKIIQDIGLVTKQSENASLPKKIKECLGKVRVRSSSLLIPQTLFIDKMSLSSQDEVYDLLKFYRQFSNTLKQVICSNNLISCPIKNFIICLEDKLDKKRVKTQLIKKEELLGTGEESRRVRKTRQINNDIILYEIRAFLEAYTEFVWMFLQLHLMEESSLGKIIQSEVLFGVIFKHLWNFVDWISDRGYEFQEAQLEEYFAKKSSSHVLKIPEEKLKLYLSLLQELRGEKHPQTYLKKLVVFYRQVSRQCQNADDLLGLYEEVIKHCASQNGIRDLRLFRMRNIIEKLLKIEESSLSGGEITYSWTTWCIMIELLKEKVNYRYGKLIISKKASGQVMKLKESQLSWEELKINSLRLSSDKERPDEEEKPKAGGLRRSSGCFSLEQKGE